MFQISRLHWMRCIPIAGGTPQSFLVKSHEIPIVGENPVLNWLRFEALKNWPKYGEAPTDIHHGSITNGQGTVGILGTATFGIRRLLQRHPGAHSGRPGTRGTRGTRGTGAKGSGDGPAVSMAEKVMADGELEIIEYTVCYNNFQLCYNIINIHCTYWMSDTECRCWRLAQTMNHCTETKTICLSRLSPIHVVDPITNYPNPQLKGFNFNPIGGGNGFTTLSLVRFKSALIPPILIIITNMLTYHKSWGWFCWENLPSHAVLVERVNLLDPFGFSKSKTSFQSTPFFVSKALEAVFWVGKPRLKTQENTI